MSASKFSNNIISNNFQNNSIGTNFIGNIIHFDFIGNTASSEFKYNEIKTPINLTDFTEATHVYGNYNCTIFKNINGYIRLSYYDEYDSLTIKSNITS
jgi:hypothetical protein